MNTHCSEHGEGEATCICLHIIETLRDRNPRGFLWHRGDETGYQAICDTCNTMPYVEWDAQKMELLSVVCLECFKRAAELNKVTLS